MRYNYTCTCTCRKIKTVCVYTIILFPEGCGEIPCDVLFPCTLSGESVHIKCMKAQTQKFDMCKYSLHNNWTTTLNNWTTTLNISDSSIL